MRTSLSKFETNIQEVIAEIKTEEILIAELKNVIGEFFNKYGSVLSSGMKKMELCQLEDYPEGVMVLVRDSINKVEVYLTGDMEILMYDVEDIEGYPYMHLVTNDLYLMRYTEDIFATITDKLSDMIDDYACSNGTLSANINKLKEFLNK